jgi:hypothetical protein
MGGRNEQCSELGIWIGYGGSHSVRPIIAFAIVITVEMLTDLVTKVGATAVWPVAAGAMGWVLLRKYTAQPHPRQLRSEEA